jgi:hypothetical protein
MGAEEKNLPTAATPPASAPARETPSRQPAKLSRTQRAKVGVVGLFGWLGIVGIGAAVGAIMGSQDARGWIIGVVVSGVTVILGLLLRRALRTH